MNSLMISEDSADTVCFVGRQDCFNIAEFLDELNDPDGEPLLALFRKNKTSFTIYFIDGMEAVVDGLLRGDIGHDIYTVAYSASLREFEAETYDKTLSRMTPEETEARITATEAKIAANHNRIN